MLMNWSSAAGVALQLLIYAAALWLCWLAASDGRPYWPRKDDDEGRS